MNFLRLIPLPWKIGASIGLLIALWGGYEAWAYHERSLGAANLAAKNAQAIAKQQAEDAALNRKLAIALQARVTQLEAVATAAGQKIDQDPVEPGSQADVDAAAAVRCMLDKTLCGR